MTTRALEAGAEAAYHATPRNKPYDKLTLFKKNLYRAEAAAVITAYEARLRAEGFVVVPVEPTEAMLRPWGNDPTIMATREANYRAMLAAAQEPS